MEKTIMNHKTLRKLAKTDKFQILYNRAKELGTLKLFKNTYDLTKIQTFFLYYLELYSGLYRDLNAKEPYISEEVIDDDIRTDAYVLWRRTLKHKEQQNKKVDKGKRKIDFRSEVPTLLFNKKKGKVKTNG